MRYCHGTHWEVTLHEGKYVHILKHENKKGDEDDDGDVCWTCFSTSTHCKCVKDSNRRAKIKKNK